MAQRITNQERSAQEVVSAYLDALRCDASIADVYHTHQLSPAEVERNLANIKAESRLLSDINIIHVSQSAGISGVITAGKHIASRTSESNLPRTTTALTPPPTEYETVQTDTDLHISYDTADAWGSAGLVEEFRNNLEKFVAEQYAADWLTIGFNGLAAAEQTNIVTYPLLQDVNTGWLQKIRDNAPNQVIDNATIGAGGQYATYDSLVFAGRQKLHPALRKNNKMTVMLDLGALTSQLLALEVAGDTAAGATLRCLLQTNTLGGLPVYDEPRMPNNRMLITRPNNLSIYLEKGTWRRFIKEEPSQNQLSFFMQQRSAYIVEDYESAVLIEGMTLLEPEQAKEPDNG